MRVGELCAGYGGLGMGVQAVLGGELAWVSEYEPPSKATPRPTQAAARILAHRFPGVPNLGDMTVVDWSRVEPVDVLTGGTPCQDLSHAGKRQGMTAGTRSNLWVSMREAIATLRPSLVLWENVRGAYSAPADSELESREGRLGILGDGPVLRALGRVLGDLSSLGFDAEWCGISASDVGAPHGRFRVFVVAWPAADADGIHAGTAAAGDRRGQPEVPPRDRGGAAPHPDGATGGERWLAAPGQAESGRARADARGRDRASAAHAHGDAVREQPVPVTGRSGPAVAGLAGTGAAADAPRNGRYEGQLEPARLKRGSDAALGGDAAADADSDGLEGLTAVHLAQPLSRRGHVDGLGVEARRVDWGPYAAAVHRWERLTRPAPVPTERGRNGQPRLSPAFVEWLMGLPTGWVTDVPGITRNEALKALGNGVVPQQAAEGLRRMLGAHEAAA